jgi:cytochrome c-type biogenesis protein CcsB
MLELRLLIIVCYLLGAAGYFSYLLWQKEGLQKGALLLLILGFIVHSLHIGIAFGQSGKFPAQNMQQTLIVAGWALVAVYLWLQYKFNLKVLGVYAAPLAAFIMLAAARLPTETIQTQIPFKSLWLTAHVVTIFLGEAAFALACGTGVLYLIQEHGIKSKKRGFFFKRLPSLELLDATGYACIVIGFTLMTVGLVTGFVFAQSVWGRFWSWDPKEIWAGVTWVFYAALLHERLTVGWRGRRAAIMAIIGFAVLLFTFLGVNFLFSGHHVEFTRL